MVFEYAAPFLLGWAALWGLRFFRFLRRRKQVAARDWRSVDGMILSCEVKQIGNTTYFRAILTYSYYAEAGYRAGKYEVEFSKESDGDEFARSVKDHRLQIRYKPSNPDVSIVDESAIAQLSPVRVR